MIETQGGNAAPAIAVGGQFTGTGATGQADAPEALLQGLGQGWQVVLGGAEEQHKAQVRVQQLAGQLLGGELGGAGPRHGTDHPLGLKLLHGCLLGGH
ncbi:hypothetical protein D3C81_1234030 [compost metagenome]